MPQFLFLPAGKTPRWTWLVPWGWGYLGDSGPVVGFWRALFSRGDMPEGSLEEVAFHWPLEDGWGLDPGAVWGGHCKYRGGGRERGVWGRNSVRVQRQE